MITHGCHPNVVAYTSMLDVLCRNFMFDQAHCLLKNILMENYSPNTVMLNTFIKGLCAEGRIDWAMKLFDQMENNGCSPNATSFNELLNGLFKVNNFTVAFELIEDMEKKEIELNLVTHNTIIKGFCCAGMLEETLKLLGRRDPFQTGHLTPEEGARAPTMVALLPDGAPSGRYFHEMKESDY